MQEKQFSFLEVQVPYIQRSSQEFEKQAVMAA